MASFKTAYDQREILVDVEVVGNTKVGDYVKLTVETATVSAYLAKTKISTATHIVAQSDQTLEYGHVPVEKRDYRYSNVVAKTVDDAPIALTGTTKKVALYKIIDSADVIADSDAGDCVAE